MVYRSSNSSIEGPIRRKDEEDLFWAISLSRMQKKVRFRVVGLWFFFCRFDLKERRKRRLVKVTLGYPQALEEG